MKGELTSQNLEPRVLVVLSNPFPPSLIKRCLFLVIGVLV